jgi:hypothetical protein
VRAGRPQRHLADRGGARGGAHAGGPGTKALAAARQADRWASPRLAPHGVLPGLVVVVVVVKDFLEDVGGGGGQTD